MSVWVVCVSGGSFRIAVTGKGTLRVCVCTNVTYSKNEVETSTERMSLQCKKVSEGLSVEKVKVLLQKNYKELLINSFICETEM